MLFSDTAKHLLVGGDDEKVRVWNVETFRCEQILEDPNWGQVTCLTWLYHELPSHESITALCVGNARGSLSIYPMDSRAAKPFTTAATSIVPFKFNDSVERQAYDGLNQRLAVASHSGEVKMYKVDIASVPCLTLLWEATIGDVIPSALSFFGGANQSLITAGLENSEISCRDAENNIIMWQKTLIGGIGCAALSNDETLLLVNNLTAGNFDLYNISDKSLLRSLPIGSQRKFAKQCKFIEGSKFAVCGSDTNKVHIVDITNNYVVQTLATGKALGMAQTIATTEVSSRRMVIAGACGGSVFLWEKHSTADSKHWLRRCVDVIFYYNLHICLVIIAVTFTLWYPPLSQFVNGFPDPHLPPSGPATPGPTVAMAPVAPVPTTTTARRNNKDNVIYL